MEENFAEDPHLVSAYGVSAVRGLQGHDGLAGAESYLGSPATKVCSQAKHFAMYGAGPKDGYTPMGGGPSIRTLFEIYLRPWRDFALSGGRGVMAAHNMIDWVPCHANRKMLTDTLRNRFGLRNGYIGSDNTNVEGLSNYFQGYAASADDGAAIAMAAGVDQDMPGAAFMHADKLVQQSTIANATLDRAVGNILRKKFAARLFDNPELDPAMASNVGSAAHRAVARDAATQGTVLLKNAGNKYLPLHQASVKTVAVVGPFGFGDDAKTAMLGGYSAANPGVVVTVADAMEARGLKVTTVQGSDGGVAGPGIPKAGADIPAAVAAAEAADFTVVVVGTMACGCCGRCGNGEAGDRNDLDLEGQQLELVAAITNSSNRTGKKAVVVLVHGRPASFGPGNQILNGINALFAAWRPGIEGGNAVADLIFGDANPSGKLAQAWPRSAGYIHSPSNPWFQTHTAMTDSYYFGNGDRTPLSALFPFAFGLSYTSFAFSAPTVVMDNPAAIANGTSLANRTLTVTVSVQNTGTVDGSTPVIVSYSKETRLVVRYLRMVAGFTKVHVGAGKSAVATLKVSLRDFLRYDPDMAWTDLDNKPVVGAYVLDGGKYDLFVGSCVSVGKVWDDSSTCGGSMLASASQAIGSDGDTWVYL